MGYYYAVATNFTLVKATPPEIINFFKTLQNNATYNANFQEIDNTFERFLKELSSPYYPDIETQYFISSITCVSSYFEGWRNTSDVITTNEDGSFTINTKASTKCASMGVIAEHLNILRPFLVLTDGKIVARIIGEDASEETVLFYNQATDTLCIDKGYWYGDKYKNSEHPANSGMGDILFDPPNTITALRISRGECLTKHQKFLDDYHWGFGG